MKGGKVRLRFSRALSLMLFICIGLPVGYLAILFIGAYETDDLSWPLGWLGLAIFVSLSILLVKSFSRRRQ